MILFISEEERLKHENGQLLAEVEMWRTKCRDVQVSEKADLANAPEDLRLLRIAFIALDQQLRDTQARAQRYHSAIVQEAERQAWDLSLRGEDSKINTDIGGIRFKLSRCEDEIEVTEL